MIKVIYVSKTNKLYGCCKICCCRTECDLEDTTKDTERVGLLYIKCPQCSNPKNYVSSGKPSGDILYEENEV